MDKNSNFQKLLLLMTAALFAAILLTACKQEPKQEAELPSASDSSPDTSAPYQFTDALNREVSVKHIDRVVALYGSFAEVWLNAGGTLVGTTKDAMEERGLSFDASTSIIGTVKEPNLELILSLNPDLILLSADISAQVELTDSLTQMGIPNACMRIDTFEDYLSFLRIACDLTGREDLYETNGLAVQKQIDSVLSKLPETSPGTVLLLRAYSTGAKAKTDDNFTGVMLEEFGLTNLASLYPSLLEDLSMELILAEDPDFIFVTTMGAEEKALEALHSSFESDPAFQSLSAVKNGHFFILPKDLFHYKPNARWGESYEYLAQVIWPDIFQ